MEKITLETWLHTRVNLGCGEIALGDAVLNSVKVNTPGG